MENTIPPSISPIPPSPPSTPNIPPINNSSNVTKTTDNKTLIAILLLFFLYPIGLIFMWFWPKWPLWLKIVLSLPILLGLITIPLAISLIAINPSKQFAQANNTHRASDVREIASALMQYRIENGSFPPTITAEPKEISSVEADICKDIVPTKIAALPVDPVFKKVQPVADCNTLYSTGYTVSVDTSGKITVSALKAELNATISETR